MPITTFNTQGFLKLGDGSYLLLGSGGKLKIAESLSDTQVSVGNVRLTEDTGLVQTASETSEVE